ncbi:hypothetical protein AAHA92_29853 [Salvia divinorum]|uniref:Senescence regulator n=1 Tax=Salvia divinorum TaxID=28513 RepID=A0ABD1G2D5_SALDI
MADFDGSGGGIAAEDYEEEEVWATMKARDQRSNSISISTSTSNTAKHLATSSTWHSAVERGIRRSCGGASSAPLAVPGCSKMLKKNSRWGDACGGGGAHDINVDGDDEMLPPHEYVARRVASAQIASFSMCEGVGRTLKGRDLSNLRNAILTKTGFLE